jgi:chemotaxis signal transduction protein
MQSFLKHMPQVQDYVRRLDVLQENWGSLSLLSQMTGGGTDLADTRKAFETLSGELVAQLTSETRRKVGSELGARAQVAIDVLVRNLFERTADIGFLSLDDDILRFMREPGDASAPQDAGRLRERFREYAARYSVYCNVVLLAPDGRVLVQLDERNALACSADPLVARTLSAHGAYVESFGATDLVAGGEPVLTYSWRVEDQRRALGVLALVFRFEDEMRAIFGKLRSGEDDWTVFALLDGERRVIASSDPWQLPIGAPLPPADAAAGSVVRFAGREYLAVTRATAGYQGYMGPQGWTAQAMLPLEQAFGQRGSSATAGIEPGLLAAVHRGADIFSPELRAIPKRADRIQRDLNRSVWNGNLRQAGQVREAGDGGGRSFAGVLLHEISATGRRTQELFARSIGDLQETVMSSLLEDGRFRASLAAEILDRSLYERANDCRWWALNGTLRACLEGKAEAAAAAHILGQTNALYTVYDHILLFDRDGRVAAVSKPEQATLVGQRLSQEWVSRTLALRDSQSWVASPFEPLDSYGGRPTWVFATVLRGADGMVRGGIAIVFDSAPQLDAMLQDVLPRDTRGGVASGCTALFVDGEARVLAASAGHAPGEVLELPAQLLRPEGAGAVDIVQQADGFYAVGARRCAGYREFQGLDVTAIVMQKLGDLQVETAEVLPHQQLHSRLEPGQAAGRVATFASAGQWLAVPATQVVEAVEGENVTRLPGGQAWYPGVVRFGDEMIPVIDLGRWIGARQRGAANTIVVVQEDGARLGLLVDQLGDVVEIGAGDIVEVQVAAAGGGAGGARVARFRDAQDATLPVVDVGTLLGVLR